MSKTQRLLQKAPELSDAEASWVAEIDRRLDALDSGRAKTVSWRAVEQGLLKRGRASHHR